MPLTLYSAPVSLYSAKVEIALREKQLDAEIIRIPFSLQSGFTKPSEVLRINPKREIPVLIDDDLELFDSTVINDYLEDIAPRPALWPASAQERARARMWELRADEVFGPPLEVLLGSKLRPAAADAIANARRAMAEFYEQLDSRLWEQPYLADRFSYADIAMYVAVVYAKMVDAGPPAELKALQNWMTRMRERESVSFVLNQQFEWLRQSKSANTNQTSNTRHGAL